MHIHIFSSFYRIAQIVLHVKYVYEQIQTNTMHMHILILYIFKCIFNVQVYFFNVDKSFKIFDEVHCTNVHVHVWFSAGMRKDPNFKLKWCTISMCNIFCVNVPVIRSKGQINLSSDIF